MEQPQPAPPDRPPPTPPEPPREREHVEEVIRWLRLLGGRSEQRRL